MVSTIISIVKCVVESEAGGLCFLQELSCRLQHRCFHSPFRPKKWGIRALCISSCELARENFTLAYRSFVERCREVWRRWKLGELHLKLPPGAFIPPRAPLASLLPLEGFG